MTPQRISLKFFATPAAGSALELQPFVGLFHRFIQAGSLAGLLLDVADYAHVPDGPGVILIGHDVDYSIDLTGGRAGLLTTRKRCGDRALSEVFRDTARRALLAIREVEADACHPLRFDPCALELRLLDRLAAPNTDAAYQAARREIEPVAAQIFGDGAVQLTRVDADDPRKTLGIGIASSAPRDVAEMVSRLDAIA
ncbi:MAG: hypothetical protein OEM49_03675 [Myxococcales bacterium]|nr:hypothetical protein [Myxococcales bacterium]MDH5306260.1 hypothetical protein [Myxococcales bacterium]MDH5566237.1 hypothetical protein [Myxococcales bacterium]